MKFTLSSIKCYKEEMEVEYGEVFKYFKDKITKTKQGYFIEIDTLEELIKLFELAENNLIVGEDVWGVSKGHLEIAIYDDYIE